MHDVTMETGASLEHANEHLNFNSACMNSSEVMEDCACEGKNLETFVLTKGRR